MVEIRRAGVTGAEYEVTDAHGHVTTWQWDSGWDKATGNVDERPWTIVCREGERFVLNDGEEEVAVADRKNSGSWHVTAAGSVYELSRSRARATWDVRADGVNVGMVRSLHAPGAPVVCKLPDELAAPVQTLFGFIPLAVRHRLGYAAIDT